MLYAIADVFGTYNIVFVRGIGVLVSISTAITLYSICTRIYNEIAGAICMYVFGLVICWNDLDGFSFSQTETFMIFFSTLSFYFMIRAKNNTKNVLWLLFSGLSIGIAIVFKQIAITTTVGLILAFLVFNSNGLLIHKLKGIVVISFGVCISTLLSYLVLYFYGVTFYEYIEGAWLILLNSGSKISEVKEHLENFMNIFVFSRFVLFYPFLLLFFIQRRVLNKEFFIVLLIWLVFDFIGVNASGYYYGHQVKQLLPSLSIMAGIGICYGINKTYRRDIIDKKSKVGSNNYYFT